MYTLEQILQQLVELNPNEVHNYRYAISIMYILQYFPEAKSAYEVGERTNFTTVLERCMPELTIYYSEGDIRKDIKLEVDKVDLVICMEVIEHLGDIPSDDILTTATYTGSGIRGFLTNIKKYMTEESNLFITTPNVISYRSIANTLYGVHPFCYNPHVRELTPNDVQNFLVESGFQCIIKTETVWDHHRMSPQLVKTIQNFIKQLGFNETLRGDDIFVIAKLM